MVLSSVFVPCFGDGRLIVGKNTAEFDRVTLAGRQGTDADAALTSRT